MTTVELLCSECAQPSGFWVDVERYPLASVMCGPCSLKRYPPTNIRQDGNQPPPVIRSLPAWLEAIESPRDGRQDM